MTTEEIERAIEILLDNQAKHDAQIGELRDQVAETNRTVQMLADSQSQFNEMMTKVVTDLAESHARSLARHDATDARIDRLVAVVERLAGSQG
jgi:peptidoglycan hydrolase CwlO-like protein